MADPNLVDFYSRVARFERARARGDGFDAPGTLGRAYFRKQTSKRRHYLLPLLMFAACCFLMKGLIYYGVGAQSYDARVAELQQGQGFDRLGAWLMQVEPVTVFIAKNITVALADPKA